MASSRSLPDAIILGFPKCGTTALGTYLNLYPEIQVSLKELNYFSSNNYGTYDYADKFDNRYFNIDKSPTLIYGLTNIHLLLHTCPDVKIIICLRRPSDRFFSQYYFNSQKQTLETYHLALTDKTSEPGYILAQGHYVQWLKTIYELFSKDQVILVTQEAIKKDPNTAVNYVTQRLGLSRMRLYPLEVNKSKPYIVDAKFKHTIDRYYLPHNQALLKMTGIDYVNG